MDSLVELEYRNGIELTFQNGTADVDGVTICYSIFFYFKLNNETLLSWVVKYHPVDERAIYPVILDDETALS